MAVVVVAAMQKVLSSAPSRKHGVCRQRWSTVHLSAGRYISLLMVRFRLFFFAMCHKAHPRVGRSFSYLVQHILGQTTTFSSIRANSTAVNHCIHFHPLITIFTSSRYSLNLSTAALKIRFFSQFSPIGYCMYDLAFGILTIAFCI